MYTDLLVTPVTLIRYELTKEKLSEIFSKFILESTGVELKCYFRTDDDGFDYISTNWEEISDEDYEKVSETLEVSLQEEFEFLQHVSILIFGEDFEYYDFIYDTAFLFFSK